MSDLCVVLPCYREEENLRVLLPRLAEAIRGLDAEVIVVDTVEPRDGTPAVAAEHGVRYVNRRGGDAFGNAVRTGIREAGGAWILFMDADGSHAPEFVPELWEARGGADVVVASRYVEGGRLENPWHLRAMSRALNATYGLVLGIRCRDISNSFKLYRGDWLRELDLRSDNFDIIEEILFKMGRRHRDLRIVELPFTFQKRMFGETKRDLARFVATYLVTLARLRMRG